jgi:hypothetical protein
MSLNTAVSSIKLHPRKPKYLRYKFADFFAHHLVSQGSVLSRHCILCFKIFNYFNVCLIGV